MSTPMPHIESHIKAQDQIDYSPANLESMKLALKAYTQRQLARLESEYAENPFTLSGKQWLPIAKNFIEDMVAQQVHSILIGEHAAQDLEEYDILADHWSDNTSDKPDPIGDAIEKQEQIMSDLAEKRQNLFPISALNTLTIFGKIEIFTIILHILEYPAQNNIQFKQLPNLLQNLIVFKFEEIVFTHSLNYWNEFGPELVEYARDILTKLPQDMQDNVQQRLEKPVENNLISATYWETLTQNKSGMLSVEGFRAFIQTVLDDDRGKQAELRNSIYELNNLEAHTSITPLDILTEITSPDSSAAAILNSHRNLAKFIISKKVTQAGDTTTMKGYKALMQALKDDSLNTLGEEYQPLPEVPTSETVVNFAMACNKGAEREKFLVSHYSTFVQSPQFTTALTAEVRSLVEAELKRYEGEEKKIKVKPAIETPLMAKIRVLKAVQQRLVEEPVQTILTEMLDAKSDLGAILAKPRGGSSTPEIITKLRERQDLLTTPGRAHLNDQGQVEIEQTKGRQAKEYFGGLFGKKVTADNDNNAHQSASQSSSLGYTGNPGDKN